MTPLSPSVALVPEMRSVEPANDGLSICPCGVKRPLKMTCRRFGFVSESASLLEDSGCSAVASSATATELDATSSVNDDTAMTRRVSDPMGRRLPGKAGNAVCGILQRTKDRTG